MPSMTLEELLGLNDPPFPHKIAGLHRVVRDEANGIVRSVPARVHWSGKFDFLFSCLGTAVGMGNIWRFPAKAYRNGGGAFIIPYCTMIFLVGIPLLLIEFTLGQHAACGPWKLYQSFSPMFKGLGICIIISAIEVATYYQMIIAWTIFYFFDSFRSTLPWQSCSHSFNTEHCFIDADYEKCKHDSQDNVYYGGMCYNSTYANSSNITDIPALDRRTPAQEYFNLYVLNRSPGVGELTSLEYPLVLTLLLSWLILIGCLIKGIESSGKVVYFTATFPYFLLFVLFIQGLTLEGSTDGLRYYVTPDIPKLKEGEVWKEAAIQVFYSFSIGGGGMVTYASYNRYNNNIVRDVILITLFDTISSLFSGLVVFSSLGFIAQQLKKNISDVVEIGSSLVFVVYPEAIYRMPGSVFWAILFFLMLFLLGIDSQFAAVETLLTAIFDEFKQTRRFKPLIVFCTGMLLFAAGLPLASNAGLYVLELMDYYAAGWPYLFAGFAECLVLSYVYGVENFLDDIYSMTGYNFGWWIKSHIIVIISTVCPALIAIIMVGDWVFYEPLKLKDYDYPLWADRVGLTIAIVPILFIPLGMLHEAYKHRKHPKGIIRRFRPTQFWYAHARQHQAMDGENAKVEETEEQPAPRNKELVVDEVDI